MRVLILTPLPVEFDAVIRFLTHRKPPVVKEAAAYESGSFSGQFHQYEVTVREPGMHNVDMALATEKAIQHYQPHIILLVGIAGGVKDVRIGDVLIARKVYGYESGKEDEDGFKARPAVESFSADLLAHAQLLARRADWQKRASKEATDAKIFLGPIAAGEKVIAATDNPSFERIKTHYNDTLALEMEAIGFATALQNYRAIHGLAIRGISDMCAGKSETDKQDNQPMAADRAAAVAFELLYQLDASGFIAGESHTANPSPPAKNGLQADISKNLRNLIAAGKIKEAIAQLLQYTAQNNADAHELATKLSADWQAFSRKDRMGILSNDEANLERSKITARFLAIVAEL